jgi:hypothetical protein
LNRDSRRSEIRYVRLASDAFQNKLQINSSFGSGHRFSDATNSLQLDAPSMAGSQSPKCL